MTTNIALDRRQFLVMSAMVGGGMAIGIFGPPPEAAAQTPATGRYPINPKPWLPPVDGGVEVNPWIVIGPDN